MKRLLYILFLCQSSILMALSSHEGRWAVKGGVANASIAWLGPVTAANLKIGAGGEYWFNNHMALGADIGMGGEGYGKVIGTTSQAIINLKTGDFIIDPGISGTFALDPMGHFRFYSALRIGFPLYSGYPGGVSLGPAVGSLIAINHWIALDLAASCTVTTTFRFNYLATVVSLGSIGFRIFI